MPPPNQPVPVTDAFQSRAAAGHSLRLFIILIVGLLIVAGFAWYVLSLSGGGVAPAIRFSLIENGGVQWYEASGANIMPVSGPPGYDGEQEPVSEAASALLSKQVPVIVGTALGIMGSNGGYRSVFDDGVAKTSLTSAPMQNWAAFVETTSGAPKIMLYQFNLPEKDALSVVGGGFSAAFAGTDIIAFDSQGLIRTGMDGKQRILLAAAPALDSSVAAIAPDGSAAAWKAAGGEVNVVSISPSDAMATGIGTIHSPADAVGFASPDMLIIRTGSSFSFYSIASGTIVLRGTASL